MSLPLSRRQAIRGGVAALAAGALAPAAAQTPLPTFPVPPPAQGVPPPRGLAAVGAALSGVGVYVGNEWLEWDDDARRFALARVRAWGFDFVCPKVGGYGRTWYRDEDHLRGWAASARGVGLGFVPFLYTVPVTGDADARIAAQMARAVGVVCVDMEDEWGAKERGAPAGYKGAQMASFGQVYRQAAGDLPVIVTGYGDPVTRFGAAPGTSFPHAEMAAWADAYSPQWYIGVYARYHKGGVAPALAWGRDECRQALGADYPLCPSVSLECSYSPDRLLPLPDTRLLMQSLSAPAAPVFVWEYGLMTAAHAESLLGPPSVRDVRVGLTKSASLSVLWNTHVPARSRMVCTPAAGPAQTTADDSLALTHAAGASGLAPGTACRVTVQSSTGGGDSAVVPLTVATAPATPGVFVLSALAARAAGHVTVTLLVANSADADAPDVQVTSVSADAGTVLSPAPLPAALGPLGKRDWEATGRDRATLPVVLADLPATATQLTLTVSGTAAGTPWAATLPVGLPA